MRDKYEMMYIVKPNLDQSTYDGLVSKVNDTITSNGGELIEEQVLGVRAIPQECCGETKGVFYVTQFNSDASVLKKLEQLFTVTEDLMRKMVVTGDSVHSPIIKPIEIKSEEFGGKPK